MDREQIPRWHPPVEELAQLPDGIAVAIAEPLRSRESPLGDKRYHRKSSSRGVNIFIGHRQRYLEDEKITRGRRLRFAEDIREAGNEVVHADALGEFSGHLLAQSCKAISYLPMR